MSVTYRNRRQVFVESKHDVHIYEEIYRGLRRDLGSEVSLHFIASGAGGSGSCAQVKAVVNSLQEKGNDTVYGIIDWDGQNTSASHVLVLGAESRYSIENYLFDPLLLAAFLLHENFLSPQDLGLEPDDQYFHFGNFPQERLQIMANSIVSKITVETSESADLVPCEYECGATIEIPLWYLQRRGHTLEEDIKRAFPPLKRYTKEADLKKQVVSKIACRLPELLSRDFSLLFAAIQSHK